MRTNAHVHRPRALVGETGDPHDYDGREPLDAILAASAAAIAPSNNNNEKKKKEKKCSVTEYRDPIRPC